MIKNIKITKLPNGGELREWPDGGKIWYLNGLFHRENGPACEHANGNKYWYRNGKLDREDGPAIEYISGNKAWYISDKMIPCKTQEEFERLIKLMAFW